MQSQYRPNGLSLAVDVGGNDKRPISHHHIEEDLMIAHSSTKERYRTNTQDLGWNEERAEFDRNGINIGNRQRILSGMAGGILLVSAFSRRNWCGAVLAMVGGGLLHRAVTGNCLAFRAMRIGMSGNDQPGFANDINRSGRRKVHTSRATKMQTAIEINRPPAELYRFWRSLENLPRVMNHLDSVQVINERLSHWVVKTSPAVPKVEWDAEIINEVENQRIGWRSLQGADVENTGSVEFRPIGDGRRTQLILTLQYDPPGGQIGSTIAKWLGEDPNLRLTEDLRRFKEQIESGVLPHSGDQQRASQPGR